MRAKQEYYLTLYITDDFTYTADWHTHMHAAQLLNQGDYFKNVANGINHQLRQNERKNARIGDNRHLDRTEVLLSEHFDKTSTGGTELNGVEKGCYVVKLNLYPDQVKTTGRASPCLRTPVVANDIEEMHVFDLQPEYKVRLFSQKPINTGALQDDEVAVFKVGGMYHYMLKDDREAMPIFDIHGDSQYYKFVGADSHTEAETLNCLNLLFNSATSGATPNGRLFNENNKAGEIRKKAIMILLGAIAKEDRRIKPHGQIYNEFPTLLIREAMAYQNAGHYGNQQGFFAVARDEGNQNEKVPAYAPVELEAFVCPITYEQMENPVFCTLDNTTYEREAIEGWFKSNPTSPLTRARIPEGITAADLLFSNTAVKTSQFTCPITEEKMHEPVFCSLDGHTYEKAAIEQWLNNHSFSPIDNTKAIPAGQTSRDVLFANLAIRSAIEELDAIQGHVAHPGQ